MSSTPSSNSTDAASAAKTVCLQWMQALAAGTLEDMASVVDVTATNRESTIGPPAARGCGPEAFYATAQWLREGFSDLHFEVHDVIAEDDLVVLHATMHGRSGRLFIRYDEDARPLVALPGTGNRVATTQTHWFRVRDGKVIEHWANRDDIGTVEQLLGRRPSPRHLARIAWQTLRLRRKPSANRQSAGAP